MISEFTLTSPAMYDKEPEKHPGVKHLGDLLAFMAESKALAKVRLAWHGFMQDLGYGNENVNFEGKPRFAQPPCLALLNLQAAEGSTMPAVNAMRVVYDW